MAGSLANCVCESTFHFVDTVNIKAKVDPNQKSTYQQVRAIYTKEGLFGFGRGFSACFYGSIFCGFYYFYLYKNIKNILFGHFGENSNHSMIYLSSAMISEMLTILVHFPYDMVKCRLQTKNYHFKYKNLFHAFSKELKNNGVRSLY
jgi:solute carrier family 25 protein 38